MTFSKRVFDLLGGLIGAIVLAPLTVVVALAVLILDGRPVFYLSERMQTPTKPIKLIKFRTMKPVAQDSGVSGGHKADRITSIGRFLRRTHLDEIPQIWNVVLGDISFVGPRPQLREIVERFPDVYREVLKSRPGITGLASVYFSAREARLMAQSRSPEEADAIYCRVCIPRKAKLDLIYQRRRTLCYDVRILFMSLIKSLR